MVDSATISDTELKTFECSICCTVAQSPVSLQ